ncbi:unnamed protein product [Albugo candida]|uniref:WW domain-containing protein n=1 Tax=Albugo candida TaxID=65357 RepID=A0A024G7Y9_9STRA|nr:unnamed protein product [Albugo candida]|eukprot:CCI42794.1 unnamed protein product [Albugo candida]
MARTNVPQRNAAERVNRVNRLHSNAPASSSGYRRPPVNDSVPYTAATKKIARSRPTIEKAHFQSRFKSVEEHDTRPLNSSNKRIRVQFSPPEDANAITQIGTKTGYLKCRSEELDTEDEVQEEWEWRYCVLRPTTFLYCYRSEEDDSPCGVIDLEYLRRIERRADVTNHQSKQLFSGTSKQSFCIGISPEDERLTDDLFDHFQERENEQLDIVFDVKAADEAAEWIEAMRDHRFSAAAQHGINEESLEKVQGQLEIALQEKKEAIEMGEQCATEAEEAIEELQQGIESIAEEAEDLLERCRQTLESVTGRDHERLSASIRRENGAAESLLAALQMMEEMFDITTNELQQQEELLVHMRDQEEQLNEQLRAHTVRGKDSARWRQREEKLTATLCDKEAEIEKARQEIEEISQELQKCQQELEEQQCLKARLQQNSFADEKPKGFFGSKRSARARSISKRNASIDDQHQFEDQEEIEPMDPPISTRGGTTSTFVRGKHREGRANLQAEDANDEEERSTAAFEPGSAIKGRKFPLTSAMNIVRKRVSSRAQPKNGTIPRSRNSEDTASASSDEDTAPKGWTRLESRRYPGEYYYQNDKTGENSWVHPSKKEKSGFNVSKPAPSSRTQKRAHQNPSARKDPSNRVRDKPVQSVINLEDSPFVTRKKSINAPKFEPSRNEFQHCPSEPGIFPDEEDDIEFSKNQPKARSFIWSRSILPKKPNLVKSLTSARKFPSWKGKKKKAVPSPSEYEDYRDGHEF